MWRELFFQNEKFEQGVQRCLRSGVAYLNHESGLIEVNNNAGADYNTNWLYTGQTTSLRDCYLWFSVMFSGFDLVPEFCRLRCYKVVTKVRNFREAMQFHNAILAGPLTTGDLTPLHGKVGIDERFYSDGHFNGFVYCDGLEDALKKYEVVRKLVDTHIPNGKDINVIIKRSCTEFERKYGATDQPFWQSMSEEDLDVQRRIEDIVKSQQSGTGQPDWLKNKIISKMVKWANICGDKSWVDYFDAGDFLTMKAVTYHNIPIVEEKQPKVNVLKLAAKPKQKKKGSK
jgi:hypothetical protein